jgi:hypothetical protein
MLTMPPAFATSAKVTAGDEMVIKQNNMGDQVEIVLNVDQAIRLVAWINERIEGDEFVGDDE